MITWKNGVRLLTAGPIKVMTMIMIINNHGCSYDDDGGGDGDGINGSDEYDNGYITSI